MSELISGLPEVAGVILSVAIMLFGGFAMTRITKLLRLPNVTAYILTGILIGPYCLNLIPSNVTEGMSFLSDIAVAFIFFGSGEFFSLSTLKKAGGKSVFITVADCLTAMAAVFLVLRFVLKVSLPVCIVLAALSAVTAMTSTMLTIRQTGAKGDFVNTLLMVVAFDDIIGLIGFSVALSLALSAVGSAGSGVGVTLLVNLGVLLLGGGFGCLLRLLMPDSRTTDNRLIICIATLFAFCGICTLLNVSPLLGCMSMGTVYFNLTGDDKLFKQLNYFSPPILLLFFVRSGVSFQLSALFPSGASEGGTPLFVISLVYLLVRVAGKYAGTFWGCLVTGKPPSVRNWLGLALVPQAGVAIGLAALGARTLGGQLGSDLQTVILASSVLYELVGPALAKLSLYLSGSYSDKLEELVPAEEIIGEGKNLSDAELLIARIKKIQQTLPEVTQSEEEKAFTEAAEEQYIHRNQNSYRRNRFFRH